MLTELERVLAPGGRFVTFSLHSVEEILPKFDALSELWRVRAFRVKSSRWNETEHRKRAVAHTMIVCDKPDEGKSYPLGSSDDELYRLPVVLSDNQYKHLKEYAEEVITTSTTMCCCSINCCVNR